VEKLVLLRLQKQILRALVSSHSFPSKASEEFELKESVLVVLLHGLPGSGKIMSAGKSVFQYVFDGDGTRSSGENLVMIRTLPVLFPPLSAIPGSATLMIRTEQCSPSPPFCTTMYWARFVLSPRQFSNRLMNIMLYSDIID
jgi:hypothetical protein